MLEIKNVYKTYKPKKGVPVKALDGVSLSFGDTGLVFILGKSGSGKSTLLNVIGGLDTADRGEFSIKGKSSKDFSQADFDSYRNTFIGFIFQEYNILNEFTVGQNIALAMKLQGKKVDDKSLNDILEEVDLVGYGNRKPNELSGGQKQRVAIARALIKEPEIIMADEPTGALDSNTGKQVFDTLKKLSKSKLVIVVSHDREFAEYYGDRVIELADGKIISDITKETAESHKESEGLSIVDDKILHIRKGYKLTDADMKKIQQYLDRSESDTIISLDERSNESFCQIARIDKDGNQEVFRDTNNEVLSEENKKYDGSSKFIRSKLPFSHAFKIGASSVRTKPFRLFMTILLCLVSFAMFGLADAIGSYNAKKTTVNSIIDSNYDSAVFGAKMKNGDYYRDTEGSSVNDLKKIKEKTGMDFTGVAYTDAKFNVYEPNKLTGSSYYSPYYTSSINGYLPAGEENFRKYGFSVSDLIGRQPVDSNEIVITKYTYDHFALAGLYYYEDSNSEQKTIKTTDFDSPKKFLELNPYLSLTSYNSYGLSKSKNWKIVGIVDTKADADGRYNAFKPSDTASNETITSYLLGSECEQYFKYGYHSLGYVSDKAYNDVIAGLQASGESVVGNSARGYFYFQTGSNYGSVSFASVANSEDLNKLEIIWLDGARNSLAENEYIISINDADSDRLLNYNGSDKVEIDDIEIAFNKTYFNGLVSVNVTELSDLKNYLGNYIALLEGASALTNKQVEKFRTYIKDLKTEYGQNRYDEYRVDSFIKAIFREAERITDYGYSDQVSFDLEDAYNKYSSNNEINIDEMTVEELKFLYVGYLNSYSIHIGYDEDDMPIEVDGGIYKNAIGLDSGTIVKDFYSKKLYYSELLKAVQYGPIEIKQVGYEFRNSSVYYEIDDGKIVGFYLQKGTCDEYGRLEYEIYEIIVNDAIYSQAGKFEPSVYSFFVAPMPKDRAQIEKLVEIHYDKSEERGLSMINGVTYLLGMVNDLLEILGKVFLYIGICLALFSMLLLSNYIAVSISYKKREIGILRAVGAKSSDVFSIFFSESLIIALINFVLSMIVSGVGCMLLNNMMRKQYGIQITLLNFGFRQIAFMLLISVVVAIVSSFLPVYKLSRKKPIETIRTA